MNPDSVGFAIRLRRTVRLFFLFAAHGSLAISTLCGYSRSIHRSTRPSSLYVASRNFRSCRLDISRISLSVRTLAFRNTRLRLGSFPDTSVPLAFSVRGCDGQFASSEKFFPPFFRVDSIYRADPRYRAYSSYRVLPLFRRAISLRTHAIRSLLASIAPRFSRCIARVTGSTETRVTLASGELIFATFPSQGLNSRTLVSVPRL